MDESVAPDGGSTLPSSLSPSALKQLFFAPTKYFQSAQLAKGQAWLFAAWLSGISSVIDRVDQRLLRSDLGVGQARGGIDSIVDSWPRYWSFLLAFGVLWAAWNWWVGGWWYRVRLRWSGASGADPRQARLVYTFAGFVVCMPAVAYVIGQTALYPSYRVAWEADSSWSAVLLVFMFWSIIVSWRGVTASFPVRRTPALWWFAVLPACLYTVLIGVLGGLMANLDTPADLE
jgi:hypothetical protein